jgi:small-conductance mechanosensitive channel
MGIATTKVLVVISSQLLVVVFIFGNACKTVFEALIFVFIMHPFDVGDRCVIDGIQVSNTLPCSDSLFTNFLMRNFDADVCLY